MKILVTGSNGLTGQKLTDLLLKHPEHELIATGKGEDRYPNQFGYFYESMDVTSIEEVLDTVARHRPHCIINTAAMTNVDACETEKESADLMNTLSPGYLARAANNVGAHLIHISTDFIFDGTHGPLKEDERPNPLSYYALGKLKGEQAVMLTAQRWSILRTVLVYGITLNMSRSNVVLWAKGALEKGETINVVDDQFRTPTLAEDLAMGCFQCATSMAEGIYNISGKDFMSIIDLVYRVADHWGLDKSLVKRAKSADIKQPAKRPPITGFNIGKAKASFGYEPHSFEEGLAILRSQL